MVIDAIDKMLTFLKEWLYIMDIRNGDIPGAIVILEFTEAISIIRGFDPLVIYLYLAFTIHIIIDGHFLTTDDRDTPYLAWIKPAYVYISRQVVGKGQT